MTQIGRAQFREHRQGFDIMIEMHTDEQTRPSSATYSAGDIAAWEHTDWRFVAVRVTAGRPGYVLGDAWQDGFGYGWFPHPAEGPVTEIHRNPIDQANIGYAADAIEGLIVKAVARAQREVEDLANTR